MDGQLKFTAPRVCVCMCDTQTHREKEQKIGKKVCAVTLVHVDSQSKGNTCACLQVGQMLIQVCA